MSDYSAAWAAFQAGDLPVAEARLHAALAAGAAAFETYNLLAVVELSMGKPHEALTAIAGALSLQPQSSQALFNRGVILQRLSRDADAIAAYEAALVVRPQGPEILGNLALSLLHLGRLDEALTRYDQTLTLDPRDAAALNARGVVLQRLGRQAEALAAFEAALAVSPEHPLFLANRGGALQQLGLHQEALDSLTAALARNPGAIDPWINRGVTLHRLRRYDEALEDFARALALNAGHPGALKNRGVTLTELRRLDEAMDCYDRAARIRPDDLEIVYNRGVALEALKRPAEALECYDRVLAAQPQNIEALNNRGAALQAMRRFSEALVSFEAAMAASAARGAAEVMGLSGAASCALRLCDWDRRAHYAAALDAEVAAGRPIVPFMMLSYGAPADLQLKAAKAHVAHRHPPAPPLWTGPPPRRERLKVAYLTADWRPHPMGYLTVDIFARHDRARFDVVGLSFGPPSDSWVRQRVVASLDAFHDIDALADAEAAALMRRLDVDIAIDLMGHTQDSRPGIFAFRPAPVQATWLGCPATTGAPYMDYVLADPIVLPKDDQPFFSETIVHLPDCYQSNDSQRPVSAAQPTRAEAGLPDQGFVFCCFNNAWKITREFFDVWMGLLKAVPGSVLWLLSDSPEADAALLKAAADRGVDPNRLVFAPHLVAADHLARHRLADLFLDTLPYNAHTTGSDALWAGVPIVTLKGRDFPGRVAASLLTNVGLPELITDSLADYAALALRLAHDPAALAGVKARLAENRKTCPLFDTPRFVRGLEAAYEEMWRLSSA